MHRNDRAVGIRRRISFIIIAALLKEILPPANVQEWGLGKISCNAGWLWCTYGVQHSRILAKTFAHLGKNAGDLRLLNLHLLEFAFLPRVSKRGKTCFSVSAHIARKFFNFFSKLRGFPNVATPAVFMQWYCNRQPPYKKHFSQLFLMRIFCVFRLVFFLILACNIR